MIYEMATMNAALGVGPGLGLGLGLDEHDLAAGGTGTDEEMTALSSPSPAAASVSPVTIPMATTAQASQVGAYPFYAYHDHSKDADPDPFYPLVPPGETPNFPAKMHAILSRADLQDIIAWMPHGRSWQVLKPREFEVSVVPTFFSHSKYSSFVRQANGWGFKRISQGPDRGSYYHPKFLRGLPHLCKTLKRQKAKSGAAAASKKQKKGAAAGAAAATSAVDPDLYKISSLYPVPEQSAEESVMLANGTGSNRTPMPVSYSHSKTVSLTASPPTAPVAASVSNISLLAMIAGNSSNNMTVAAHTAPMVSKPMILDTTGRPIMTPEVSRSPSPQSVATTSPTTMAHQQQFMLPPASMVAPPVISPPQVQATQMAMPAGMQMPGMPMMMMNPTMNPYWAQHQQQAAAATAIPAPVPQATAMPPAPAHAQQPPAGADASSFAAGFAAAAAFSQQHFGKLFESMALQHHHQQHQFQQQAQVAPPQVAAHAVVQPTPQQVQHQAQAPQQQQMMYQQAPL